MSSMHQRAVLVCLLTVSVLGPHCMAERRNDVQSELANLKNQIILLKIHIERQAKEIEQLQSELTTLREQVFQAGVVPVGEEGEDEPRHLDGRKPVKTKDANTAACQVIEQYIDQVMTINSSDATTLQKKTEWSAATKATNNALKRLRVTVECEIENVQYDAYNRSAKLSLSRMSIRSRDERTPDVLFSKFYNMSIDATQRQASSITKGSKLTLMGNLALNVNLAVSVAEQPSLINVSRMPGYRPLGVPNGMESLHFGGLVRRTGPILMIRNTRYVDLEGLRRRLK